MIVIRKATIQDARKISYLIQQSTKRNPNNYSDIQMKTWLSYNTTSKIKAQFKDRTIFCAFKNNKLVGTIALKGFEVVGFYVSFSQRNKGIGQQLFNFIQNYVVHKKHQKLILTATPSAIKFYEKQGFKILNEKTVTLNAVNYIEFDMEKYLQVE